MESKNRVLKVVVFALMLLPLGVCAQNSSLNAFSPYTMYGLGDMSTQGTAALRSMGGAGVAFSSPFAINYLNPASAAAMRRESFLFNFGLEGQNFYTKNENASTSFNTFNVRDVAVQFPIYKGIGFTVSMTPFSSVGYDISRSETDQDIIGEIGDVKYEYGGEGNVSKFQFALGMKIVDNLSVGAQLDYYHGSLNRSYSTNIYPVTGGGLENTVGLNNELVSRVGGTFGVQYAPIVNMNHYLSIGAVYRMGVDLNSTVNESIYREAGTSSVLVDNSTHNSAINLPPEYSIGISYLSRKFTVNADYTHQEWGASNNGLTYNYNDGVVRYKNTNSFKIGTEYVPNRGDIRTFYKRMAYRVGFKYSDYYLQVNNHDIADKAITFGLGVPVKLAGETLINLGVELGERGSTRNNLLKESYFKFSIGMSLFGAAPEDYWFYKPKYN